MINKIIVNYNENERPTEDFEQFWKNQVELNLKSIEDEFNLQQAGIELYFNSKDKTPEFRLFDISEDLKNKVIGLLKSNNFNGFQS